MPWGTRRPFSRAGCVNRPRPCPWVSCKYHLAIDVRPETGSLVLNFGRQVEPVRHADGVLRERGRTRRAPAVAERLGEARAEDGLDALVEAFFDGRPSCALDIADDGGRTLEEVARMLNISRERVRQIEAAGLARLRQSVRPRHIEEPPEDPAGPLALAEQMS